MSAGKKNTGMTVTRDRELAALIDACDALDVIEALYDEDSDEDWTRVVAYLSARYQSTFTRAQMIADGEV